jgi:hypothetical protein
MGQGGYNPGPLGNPAELLPATFCNPDKHPHDHSVLPREQIGESFSDWMGMEVTTSYIERNFKLTEDQHRKGYSNIWRSSCYILPKDQMENGEHPPTSARIDKMILVHPKAREHMKCPPQHPEHIYCDPQNSLPVSSGQPGGGLIPPSNNLKAPVRGVQ